MSQIPAHVSAFDADGNPISIPLGGQSAVSGNRTNPLGDVNSILQGMQARSRQSTNAAIAATERANAMLFPLRQDPRKTARINERRRAMRVGQSGRTEGQKRRDSIYRQQAMDRNAERKRREEEERLALERDLERLRNTPFERDPAYQDYLDEMAANERESLDYQQEQKEARYQKLIDDTLADLPQDDAIALNEADIEAATRQAMGNAEGTSEIADYDVDAMMEAVARRRAARESGRPMDDPDLAAIAIAGENAAQAERDRQLQESQYSFAGEDHGGFTLNPLLALQRGLNAQAPPGTQYGAPGMIPTDAFVGVGEALGYDMSEAPRHLEMPIGMSAIRPYHGGAARVAPQPPPMPYNPAQLPGMRTIPPANTAITQYGGGMVRGAGPMGPLRAPPGYVTQPMAGQIGQVAMPYNPIRMLPGAFRPNFLGGAY